MVTTESNNRFFDPGKLNERIADNKKKLGEKYNYVKLGMSNVSTIKKVVILSLKILSCFTIVLAPFVFYSTNKHLNKVAKRVIFKDNFDLIKQEIKFFDKIDSVLIRTFYLKGWLKEGKYITYDSLISIRNHCEKLNHKGEEIIKGKVKIDNRQGSNPRVAFSSKPQNYTRVFHPTEIGLLTHPVVRQCMQELIKNQHNPSWGYPICVVESLISYYMAKRDEENSRIDSIFINQDGTTQPNEETKDKIAFSHHLNLESITPEATKALTDLLEKELRAHPNKRPAKIFIPYALKIPGKTNHVVFLVVEPDANIPRKANITMINTLGNSPANSYLKEERLILEAAKSIYNRPETKIGRNTKVAFSGSNCGIDCIENIRLLANVKDVQGYISENKLPRRDQAEIALICREHAAELNKILNPQRN